MRTRPVLHPVLAPVVLLATVPNGWASVRTAKLSYESFLRMISRMRRLGITSQMITSRDEAAEIRAFTAQHTLLGEHRRIADQLCAETIRVEHRKTVIRLVGRTLTGVGTALGYLVLGLLLYAGAMPLALAGAAAVAMRTAGTAVSNTVFAANRLYEHSFYLDLLTSCLGQARDRHRCPPERSLPREPALIEVVDVSFTYPGQDEPAGSVPARPGPGLLGRGGHRPGRPARAARARRRGTAEPRRVADDRGEQRPHRPAGTPDPDGSVLAATAAESGADTVVAELSEGWNTVLSRQFQNGRDLSGGQWQRISVARGLYRDAPVLVADEPTAAMDARAESAVFRSLQPLSRASGSPGADGTGTTRTTLLITHRLANIRHADQIVVLDRGRVTEQGTHDELMAHGGTYRELFTLQARAYLGDGLASNQPV